MDDYFALLNSLGLNRQAKISQIRYFSRFDYQIRPKGTVVVTLQKAATDAYMLFYVLTGKKEVECYYNSHFEGYCVAKYGKVARMAFFSLYI